LAAARGFLAGAADLPAGDFLGEEVFLAAGLLAAPDALLFFADLLAMLASWLSIDHRASRLG
jgi:hypothetical protein